MMQPNQQQYAMAPQQMVVQEHRQVQQPQQKYTPEQLEPITKMKLIFAQLVEALQEALRNAGCTINQNSQLELGTRNAGELASSKLEEMVEKFYSMCDQMEFQLRSLLDYYVLLAQIEKYTPPQLQSVSGDGQKYRDYLTLVKAQVNHVNEFKASLSGLTNLSYATASARQPADPMNPMETSN